MVEESLSELDEGIAAKTVPWAHQIGVDLKVVSEPLGHSQLAITADLYTHINRGLGKAAAEQITRALWPASPAVPTASLPQSPENASLEGGETGANT